MTISLDQNAFTAIGLAASALLVTLFAYRGNKRDLTTWLATIVGVALILLISHYAIALSHLWPHPSAAVSAPAPHPAQHTPVATHPAAHHAPAVAAAPAALDITDIVGAISFGILAIVSIVYLVIIRARKQAKADAAMTTNCPSCGKLRKVLEQSYIAGSGVRVTRRLCNDCANKGAATPAASQSILARVGLKR